MQQTEKKVLHSQLEGTWYTADPDDLRRELEGYLRQADPPELDSLCALILPHAGYAFSGPTAAAGLAPARGRDIRRVIVMGPSHRVAMQNICSVPDATHYNTPLGEVPLDLRAIAQLRRHPLFRTLPRVHAGEHSVQIHVPLLKTALGDRFELVPVAVGQLDMPAARRIAEGLHPLLDEHTLVVASTDFTHHGERFGYRPFTDNLPRKIRELDMGAFDLIKQKDAAGFVQYVQRTGATICGLHPVTILLHLLPADSAAHLLEYTTSGEITGDFDNTVSYLSAAFSGCWPAAREQEGSTGEARSKELTAADRGNLLQLARQTLRYALDLHERPTIDKLDVDITDGMCRHMGAFVTLHRDGNLRGCIGEIFPQRELYRAVMDHAVNAAFNDHRFPQLEPEEFELIDIEISALLPPRDVTGYEEIEIGRHGIVLVKGSHSSVFLPQVAPEQGWDLETTLTQLALKAGLPEDAWRSDCRFEVFEAIVFGEK